MKSEKRKQDLLDEMALEEQRGKELSKIVRELLPDSKKSVVAQKPLQARKVCSLFSFWIRVDFWSFI